MSQQLFTYLMMIFVIFILVSIAFNVYLVIYNYTILSSIIIKHEDDIINAGYINADIKELIGKDMSNFGFGDKSKYEIITPSGPTAFGTVFSYGLRYRQNFSFVFFTTGSNYETGTFTIGPIYKKVSESEFTSF